MVRARRWVLVIVSLLTLAPAMAVPRPAEAAAGFLDVSASSYYAPAVQWARDRGITTGVGGTALFEPTRPVTRAEALTMLWRSRGKPRVSTPAAFHDVPDRAYFAPAVAWARSRGITTGVGGSNRFEPQRPITRAESVTLLWRAGGEPTARRAARFADVARGAYHTTAVDWAAERGVTTGVGGSARFEPARNVTRAEFATFLYRAAGAPAVAVDPRPLRPIWQSHVPYATAGPLTLRFPAAWVEAVGYHESSHDGSVDQQPTDTQVPWFVQATRRRGTGARSAADIVIEPGQEIRAPVTGTVRRAGRYILYCNHSDELAVIEPDDRPGWEVRVLHMEGVVVRPGQRVTAGVTKIAHRARVLPFESTVEETTQAPPWPHVHVEVVDPSIPNTPKGPGC